MEKWELNGNRMWLGDCLQLLPLLEKGSVHLVLCDLPYGTTACKWDRKIDLNLLWKEYERVTSENATIILTSSQPFTTTLINSNPKLFKYEWVWVKSNTTGFQHARNRPLKNHENILVFSKGSMGHRNLLGDKRMTYNPQGIVQMNKMIQKGKYRFGTILTDRPSHKDEYIREFGNYPRTVQHFPQERGWHTSQKPVSMFEFLIRTYSNEGDTVLDNCAGSGTTGIASLITGRKFLLMEIDRQIYSDAKTRITDFLKHSKIPEK